MNPEKQNQFFIMGREKGHIAVFIALLPSLPTKKTKQKNMAP